MMHDMFLIRRISQLQSGRASAFRARGFIAFHPDGHRRPLGDSSFAIDLPMPGPLADVDPRAPLVRRGFGGSAGELPRIAGMAEAADDDLEAIAGGGGGLCADKDL